MTLNNLKKEISTIKKSMAVIKQNVPEKQRTELELILDAIMSGKSRHNICLRSTLTRYASIICTINVENKESSKNELQELYLKDDGYINSLKRIKTIINSYLKFEEYEPSNNLKLFLES